MKNKSNSKVKRKGKSGYNPKTTKDFKKVHRTFDDKDVTYDDTRKGINDSSWYAGYPQLMRDAASIPYGWPVGSTINWNNPDHSEDHIERIMPAITILDVITGPGVTQDIVGTDAINTAAFKLYSYVRHANSGSSNYEAADLMIYVYAINEINQWIEYGKRTYGMLSLYNNENKYFPRAAIRALGWDYDAVAMNTADFRGKINSAVNILQKFCCPSEIPIFKRHAWLMSGLFADGTSRKAQVYAYNPVGYRVFDAFGEKGGKLTFKQRPTLMTPDKWWEVVSEMLNAIHNNEDFGIMSGDIKKAFKNNILVWDYIDDLYSVTPVYSAEALMQIQNTIAVGPVEGYTSVDNAYTLVDYTSTHDIGQDPSLTKGFIIYKPKVAASGLNKGGSSSWSPFNMNFMISINKDDINPEDTMVATRNMVVVKDDEIIHCGSDIVTQLHVVVFDQSGALELVTADLTYNEGMYWRVSNANFTYADLDNVMSNMARLSKFKFHPPVWTGLISDSESGPYGGQPSLHLNWEVDNYAVITSQVLGQMHDIATLSLFRVPSMTDYID